MGILFDEHPGFLEIALDWPEMRNALGPQQGRELRLALEAANLRKDISAIVLSARGKAFCAGGDLAQIVQLAEGGASAVRDTIYGEFQGIFRAIAESPVPVISAVEGPAVGFGCDLALCGQVTFVGPAGWLAQGWARVGLIPATGGTLYAARRAGPQAVWQLLAADRLDGSQAQALGLAIASENAREAAMEMAQKLAAVPASTLRATLALSRIDELEPHLTAALDFQAEFITSAEFAARARKILDGAGRR